MSFRFRTNCIVISIFVERIPILNWQLRFAELAPGFKIRHQRTHGSVPRFLETDLIDDFQILLFLFLLRFCFSFSDFFLGGMVGPLNLLVEKKDF